MRVNRVAGEISCQSSYYNHNCQIADKRRDMLSFVLVEGVVYGKRWLQQIAKQRHQTEPG